MIENIQKWDYSYVQGIKYNSFAPVFKLVQFVGSPASQVWALYTIYSLTAIGANDRNKYCTLVKAERGVELIKEIQRNPFSTKLMRDYCQIILKNIVK